jgi:hypothetical protein
MDEMGTWDEYDQQNFGNIEMWWKGDHLVVDTGTGKKNKELKRASLLRYWTSRKKKSSP